MICEKHPKYQAKSKPRAACGYCWSAYNKSVGRRVVAFINDCHVGATTALWPADFVSPEITPKDDSGILIPQGLHQQLMYKYWLDFWETQAYDADTIVFLSDLIQGSNFFDMGRDLTVVSLNEQMRAFEVLIRPHIEGRKLYAITGTKYHGSRDTNIDRMLMQSLAGTYLGMMSNIEFKDQNKVINIAHGSGPRYQYTGTMTSKESVFLDGAIGRDDIAHTVEVWIRGHYHLNYHDRPENRYNVLSGSWQMWYEWDVLTKLWGSKTNGYGNVVLEITDRPITDGGITVRQKVYKAIPMKDGKVEV